MGEAAPARFGVVGGGWRTEFFLRLAKQAPSRFAVTGVVTRSADRGTRLESAWGVPTFRSLADLLAATNPEFVIPAVAWDAAPAVTKELVRRDVRVLTETPPAPDVAGLRDLWSAVGPR
jgi:predicted dehydrogenase